MGSLPERNIFGRLLLDFVILFFKTKKENKGKNAVIWLFCRIMSIKYERLSGKKRKIVLKNVSVCDKL